MEWRDCTVQGAGRQERELREDQTIEWKESWRDEYLKWICGFANAEGGRLVVGRNDKGEVVGLVDAAKLMTDLPQERR